MNTRLKYCGFLSLLIVVAPLAALACQVEYSDSFVEVMSRAGYPVSKRVGNFANLQECQAALDDAVVQSGDPSLANNMRCVECSEGGGQTSQQPTSAPSGRDRRLRGAGSSADIEAQAKKNREAIEQQRQQAFEKTKQELQSALKGGVSTSPSPALKPSVSAGSGLPLKTGAPPVAVAETRSSSAVRQEQDEFDRFQAEWLRKQQELIRQAVTYDNKWRREVLASIKTSKVPNPALRPKELDDLAPGDILLMGVDGTVKAEAIAFGDALYRAFDAVYGGLAKQNETRKPSVYHALTFVKSVDGKRLYLNHTPGGSRVLDEEGLLRAYGGQPVYIAKPQAKVDGRILWEEARNAALRQKSDYGVFGSSVVCSERAAIAVAKATGTDMDKQKHLYGLGGIDITPADFFDEKHIGKFFLVSTQPIILRGK